MRGRPGAGPGVAQRRGSQASGNRATRTGFDREVADGPDRVVVRPADVSATDRRNRVYLPGSGWRSDPQLEHQRVASLDPKCGGGGPPKFTLPDRQAPPTAATVAESTSHSWRCSASATVSSRRNTNTSTWPRSNANWPAKRSTLRSQASIGPGLRDGHCHTERRARTPPLVRTEPRHIDAPMCCQGSISRRVLADQ